MKKKLFIRGLVGAAILTTATQFWALIQSFLLGQGEFYPVHPNWIAQCGSQLDAVALQTVIVFLCGAVLGAASLIWDIERWSLLRHTLTHFAVCFLTTLPSAYLLYWMEHNMYSIFLYCIRFAGIYLSIWLVIYFSIRRNVQRMNEKVQKNRSDNV